MKKLLILILITLLVPFSAFAKTPTQEETMKIIGEIENTQVDDNKWILNTTVEKDKIIFHMEKEEQKEDLNISYEWKDKELTFHSGYAYFNTETNQIIGEIKNNDQAFYLYSILESQSYAPYDMNHYYNNRNIKEKIENESLTSWKDSSNTFGLLLKKEKIENKIEKINIYYKYYLDGDYPIVEVAENMDEEFKNPSTGNLTTYVTFTLILVIMVGVYTYINPKKEEE